MFKRYESIKYNNIEEKIKHLFIEDYCQKLLEEIEKNKVLETDELLIKFKKKIKILKDNFLNNNLL
tara:strand:+ start:7899 stop:8096 length:198 start_codon:yes stop_codon:yes gene_type:complete